MSSSCAQNRPRTRASRARGSALALILGAVAGCSSGSGGSDTEGADTGERSVLLITLDTTRADTIGFQGEGASVTPRLDELAREGVVFERAYTVAPITLPAHASMMSGLYPPRSGVRRNGVRPLPQGAETLAERAQAAGLQTAAFIGAVVLERAFGLAQGFDVYDVPETSGAGVSSHFDERPAGEVVDAALAWFRTRDRDRPFFAWVHLFDPHAPYAPPPAFRDARFGNAYRGEVAYADAEIGRLLDALRAAGELEETTVLFVADHGEAFGEHDELSHATYCYEPTLQVPMLLRRADGLGAGTRATELVSVADVHPTLLEAMGLTPDAEVDGISLYDLQPPAERGLYFESLYAYFAYGWSPLAGWLDDSGKYLHSSSPELFDLRSDPGESVDLADQRDTGVYRDAIAEVHSRPRLELDAGDGIDAELMRRIQGLGYAGVDDAEEVAPHPLAPTDRPSPASRSRELNALMRAIEAANSGRWAEAETLCEAALATDPDNPDALEQVAVTRIQQEDFAGAIEPLQKLLAGGSGRANLMYNLAISYWQVGRLEEAALVLRRTARAAPEEPRVLESLAQVLRATGQTVEAEVVERDLQALRAAGGSR